MKEKIELKNLPDKIWIQVGEIDIDFDNDFKKLRESNEVTWCEHKIDNWDIEYTRSSLIESLINQEVEKRIKEIDQHGRIAASVIKKKLWSMRFNEEDVKKETDGRRKRFIYGYTEAINDISQWLTEMVDICRRSCLTCSEKPNNSQKTEGGNQ